MDDDPAARKRGDNLVVLILCHRRRRARKSQKYCDTHSESRWPEANDQKPPLTRFAHLLQFTPAGAPRYQNRSSTWQTGKKCRRRFRAAAASGKIEAGIQQRKWQFMALKKTKSITHGGKRVSEILEAHQLFFSGKDGGVRADLSGANLSGADLGGVNLNGAALQIPHLQSALLPQP